MTSATNDVIGVGNAIVDVLSPTEDDFLTQHGLEKGMMTLIDTDQAAALYDAMGPGIEVSGGSTEASVWLAQPISAKRLGIVDQHQTHPVFSR